MFFDKYYRPERYNTIVNKIDEYQNINEFRTYVISNFYTFPLKATEKLTILPNKSSAPAEPENDQEAMKKAEESEQKGNILLEKKFLNLYTNVYKTELTLYFLLGNAIFYMGIAFTLR